ncbi:MAG: diguanylate cyclase [Burkholderiaceae bacterium]|nr:diguanylate cyclase [Burkholderiaceae bacterium]
MSTDPQVLGPAVPPAAAAAAPPPLQPVLEAELLGLLARRPAWVLGAQFGGALLLAMLALALSRMPGHVAMLWLPNAWAMCLLTVAPRRHWPGLLALQGLAIGLANLWWGDGWLLAFSFVPANLIETLVGALALSASGAYRRVQDGPLHCAQVLWQGALLPAAAGALAATLLLSLQGLGPWYRLAPTWFASGLLGSTALLPLGLGLLAYSRDQLRRQLGGWELPALLLLALGTAMLVLPQVPFPFVYLVLPLALAAMALPFVALAALLLLLALAVGAMVAQGWVPLPPWTADWQPVLLTLPLLAVLLPPLLLAAAVQQAARQREVLERSHERLLTLYEGTPAMLMSCSPDGRVLGVSTLWLERLGRRREEVIGRLAGDFLDEASRRRWVEQDLPALLSSAACRDIEYRLPLPDGRWLDVLFAATCEVDAEGRPVRLHAVLEDVTRKRLAEQLALQHLRSRVTLESVADAVITTDAQGRIEYLNPVATTLTGWTLEAVYGALYGEVLLRLDVDSGAELPDPIALCLHRRERPALPPTVLLRDRHGREHPIHESVAPMFDAAGALVGAVATFQDVTQAHALAVQLAHQAQHDGLTGLPNRLLLRDRLQQCLQLARRSQQPFALMFMDLDHFKAVNDRHGHACGDALLREVAQRLASALRSSDTACRLGGDEFVVLLPQIDGEAGAAAVAAHLLEVVGQPYHLRGAPRLSAAFSIGIALFPRDGEDEEALMRHADLAMYEAKQSGRNRYRFYSSASNPASPPG